MIYIIEIPHQLPPIAWSRASQEEVVGAILEAFCLSDNPPDYSFQESLEWNSQDLSCQLVYMTDDEAREALNNDSIWNIHQGIDARIALEDEIS